MNARVSPSGWASRRPECLAPLDAWSPCECTQISAARQPQAARSPANTPACRDQGEASHGPFRWYHRAMQTISDQIAARAYERYLARGGAHGHDVEDWLAAEAELT